MIFEELVCFLAVFTNLLSYIVCFVGVPPLVSRRVLETLTYLARNHPYVAKILLQFRLPLSALQQHEKNFDQSRGKAVMMVEEYGTDVKQFHEGHISIALLLSLLNQPLYSRSIAHLEQVMVWPVDVLVCKK